VHTKGNSEVEHRYWCCSFCCMSTLAV